MRRTRLNWRGRDVLRALNQAQIEGLELAATHVEGAAVLLCPVDTGLLRSSIAHNVDEAKKEATIGTPTNYAAYVEFSSQPYLRPALDNNEAQVKQIIGAAIRRALDT